MKKKNSQKCDFCSGELIPKITSIDYKFKDFWILIEDVPAEVCNQCGEKYLSAEVAKKIEEIVRKRPISDKFIKVPVLNWKRVAF